MATEIEAELDEHDYNDPQKSDSVSCNTSLLAVSTFLDIVTQYRGLVTLLTPLMVG